MGVCVDMVGKKFGILTVLEMSNERCLDRHIKWICKCDCGNIKTISGHSLRSNHTTSCGCFASNVISSNNRKYKKVHGMSNSRVYNTWAHMIDRCKNKNNKHFKDYGGRGVSVCDDWKIFDNFWKDMKDGYEENLTLDRIDNNSNYHKNNCRWATQKEQMNNIRTNTLINFNNEILTLSIMSKKYKISSETAIWRIKKGWELSKVFLTPVRKITKSKIEVANNVNN